MHYVCFVRQKPELKNLVLYMRGCVSRPFGFQLFELIILYYNYFFQRIKD